MSFFNELKRRNVFKVAAAYIIVGWLIMQAGDTLAPALHLPEWVNSLLVFFLLLGFPLAVFFAWAFEMTPEGIKKEKDVDRSQSMSQVTGQKLNNLVVGILVLALAYFAIDKLVLDPGRDAEEIATAVQNAREQVQAPADTPQDDNSIAVLPFVNMSSDQEQEFFSDGLSEELLNLLARIPELRVAARTSSFSFKDKDLEIPEIASRLKVDHILEGSVRKSGNQLRITAQLIQADNGYHLWSKTYDRQMDNIFQIQDEIAAAVVDALKITLLGSPPKAAETNPQAYQMYLEGQYFARQLSESSLARAIQLFKSVVEIDPGYSPAWAELAYAYLWYAGTSDKMSIVEGDGLADHALEMALSADANNAWAYFVRGMSKIHYKYDFKAGASDFEYALSLDPGNARLIAASGTGARILGRLEESEQFCETALGLDPIMPETMNYLSITYTNAGKLDEAEAIIRKLLSLNSNMTGLHYRLARVLIWKGELSDAKAEMSLETSFVSEKTGWAMLHHALGEAELSDQELDRLIAKSAHEAAYQIAEVYGFREEHDKAFEWLEQALLIGDPGLASTLGDPALRNLRTDARWQPFLEKLGLLEFWLEMPTEHGGPVQ